MSRYCEEALHFANQNRERFLENLKELVRIPSISTDPGSRAEMQRAASWIADHLRKIGMKNVAIYPTNGRAPTGGHPVVYGEILEAGANAPTVLVYGHYDVQPAEPLELWQTPPFEPTQVGENLYARGASDMKGQVIASLSAIEALLHEGCLPINIKLLIEGEEEIGSPHLGEFIADHRDLLRCDYAVNPDTGMLGADIPTITYGLRGLAYFEIRIKGPEHDLHSGLFGGVVHNPAQVLCELIAGMKDAQGRILLPGFYDSVKALSDDERAELARLPVDEDFYLEKTGAPALHGETGFSPAEQVGARPTLDVHGLLAGFIGEGSKTVIPARAMAKISMRLVPDQDPVEVQKQLEQYLKENAPETVQWELVNLAGGPASVTDRSLPAVKALEEALQATWGKRPVFKREGGSVPVVAQMEEILGIPSVLTGFGLPDDNLHAPNEKIHVPTFYRGIDALIRFISLLGER